MREDVEYARELREPDGRARSRLCARATAALVGRIDCDRREAGVTGGVTWRGTSTAYTWGMKKLLVSVFLVGVAACSRGDDRSAPSADERQALALPAGMSRVTDASQVCMVNDQFMGRPQIPVVVDGRTYYGCCPACKDKLEKQPAARTAHDPVTGEQVDKSKAVIVQDGSGKVLYFASEDTLRRFRG